MTKVDIDSPIFLLGMPRSGTTWLSQIFESSPECMVRLSPPYSYEFRGQLSDRSTSQDWRRVLRGAVASDDPFLTQNWRRDTGELTVFSKALDAVSRVAIKDTRFHRLYRRGMSVLPNARTIYIVRHPAASLWSWKNCKEFPSDAEFLTEWRGGACRKKEGSGNYWGFDDWLSLGLEYRAEAVANPGRYTVVRYEDLVRDPIDTARKTFAFCNLALSVETEAFIRTSQSKFDPRPYSIFKGEQLRFDWQNDFPADVLRTIEAETLAAGLGEYLI